MLFHMFRGVHIIFGGFLRCEFKATLRNTRTSPAGHGGTEGIGMGTVFCNVLTKPNNFLKIENLNLFFRKKIFF